jgi:hypothetical protein
MDAAHATAAATVALLPVADWIAIGLCLAGALLGPALGSGPLVRAAAVAAGRAVAGTHLSARIVTWIQNTTTPDDPQARRVAFAVVGRRRAPRAAARPPARRAGGQEEGGHGAAHAQALRRARRALQRGAPAHASYCPSSYDVPVLSKDVERAHAPRWAADSSRAT